MLLHSEVYLDMALTYTWYGEMFLRSPHDNEATHLGVMLTCNGMLAGRPVDVQPLNDGTILISDDGVGAVYRVSYSPTISATSIEG